MSSSFEVTIEMPSVDSGKGALGTPERFISRVREHVSGIPVAPMRAVSALTTR